jgi:hypothetical protein
VQEIIVPVLQPEPKVVDKHQYVAQIY